MYSEIPKNDLSKFQINIFQIPKFVTLCQRMLFQKIFYILKCSKSKSSIGSLIMNQSVMAGIGNIYRTEILWRQAVHPETPGKNIDRQTFDRIWNDAKALLTLGVKHNAIITKRGAIRSKSKYREDFNIFAKETCPDCNGEISRFEINGRRAFVCKN